MKIISFTSALFLIFQLCYGQSEQYQGYCCDKDGKPLDPTNLFYQNYSVQKFKSKTPIEININKIKLGNQFISVDFKYSSEIEYETPILNVTDSIGIKLMIGKTSINGYNRYLYHLFVYRKDNESNCWRTMLSAFPMFYEVYSQTVTLGLFGIGAPDSKNYFQIIEGWLKFN